MSLDTVGVKGALNLTLSANGERSSLTIREHFAAMAMQGLCACYGTSGMHRGIGDTAERAVQMADALIAELAKEPKS